MSNLKPRAKEIEQQLAQLRWRKMQNERTIRSYLEASKVMKQKDTILGLTIDQSAERMQWLDSIVRDEFSRPLVLDDNELHRIQYEETMKKRRAEKYCDQQYMSLLKTIRDIEAQNPRTVEGIRIRQEQLEKLQLIKMKLEERKQEIDTSKPYVNVKQVVEKLF